jgi:hypothetical protein
MRKALMLAMATVMVGAAAGAYVAAAADAGNHMVAPQEAYTVPDTSVQVTNNSGGPGSGPVLVEWDNGSANVRVTVGHDATVALGTGGTAVAVTMNGANPALTATGGSVTLTYGSGSSNGTGTVAGTGNVVLYAAGSAGNATTVSGDGNSSSSDTDPDAVLGNTTTFNGNNNLAQ